MNGNRFPYKPKLNWTRTVVCGIVGLGALYLVARAPLGPIPRLMFGLVSFLFLRAAYRGLVSLMSDGFADSQAGQQQGWGNQRHTRCDADHEAIGKYYAILDCSETDSDERIKQQYRAKAKDYHPDAIAAKGLADDFVIFANRKFQDIQEAYEKIMEHRRG